MRARRDRLAVALALGAVMAAGSAAAQGAEPVSGPATGAEPATESVGGSEPLMALVAPVQGSEALRVQHAERLSGAVVRALRARGYQETVSQELLGQAVVACQTPECVEQALDAANAAFAVVPAIWSRQGGGEELTLTLVQRSGRNLNASGVVGDDLSGTTAGLVDALLDQRAAVVAAQAAAAAAALPAPDEARPSEPKHPHAWKAGPIILIAGGTAAVVAVGVAAGIRTDTQQINTAAAATWSAIGAAAIAGGVAWWVVGEKRRRKKTRAGGASAPTMAVHPTGIDLRLRF